MKKNRKEKKKKPKTIEEIIKSQDLSKFIL